MAFNINDIKAELVGGGARPSQFQVTITNPIAPVADIKLPFMCMSASIPPSTLGIVQVPYFGRKIKLAGDREYPEWAVTIINDEDFLVRDALETWSNAVNGHESNINTTGGPQPANYKSQGVVTQYGKTGDILRVYQFNGIWPSDLQPIELDWNTVDEFERFQVTFQYDNYQIIGGITGDGGGV